MRNKHNNLSIIVDSSIVVNSFIKHISKERDLDVHAELCQSIGSRRLLSNAKASGLVILP